MAEVEKAADTMEMATGSNGQNVEEATPKKKQPSKVKLLAGEDSPYSEVCLFCLTLV